MVQGISIPAAIGRSCHMGVSMMDEHGGVKVTVSIIVKTSY